MRLLFILILVANVALLAFGQGFLARLPASKVVNPGSFRNATKMPFNWERPHTLRLLPPDPRLTTL